MSRKKRKSEKRRGRTSKVLRRWALAAAALALAVAGVWLLARGGGGGPKEYLRTPAPPFTLPTIAGDEVSLSDHLGRHTVLLYFNEGMG